MSTPILPLTMGSLFDGIGGFPLAAVRCGVEPIFASEIEPFPIAVTKRRFPNMIHVGDITKLNGAELPPVDIICGGSPCQDLSVAGMRQGLNGARSGLFMEQIRVIKEMRNADKNRGRAAESVRPRFGVWENVCGALSSGKDPETGEKMPGADFQRVLEAFIQIEEPQIHAVRPEKGRWEYTGALLGDRSCVAYVTWDAQYFGVPQRRRRLFLVADFAGYSPLWILFIQNSLSGHPSEIRRAREGTASRIGNGTDGASGLVLCPECERRIKGLPYQSEE